MENPLVLSSQLNSESRVKSLCKIMKSLNKEGPKQDTEKRAQEKRNRLSLLQKFDLHSSVNFDKLEKTSSESPENVKKWGESFDKLISQKAGLDAFIKFLRSEFSEENIEFWMACEEYKKIKEASQLPLKAKIIFETFIEKESPKEVNLDFNTKVSVSQNMNHPTYNIFDAAQNKIYALMEQDCYPRFLKSTLYLDLVHGRPYGCSALRRRSRSFTINDFKDAQPDFSIWL